MSSVIRWLVLAGLFASASLSADGWRHLRDLDIQEVSADLRYVERLVEAPGHREPIQVLLALFTSKGFRLDVIDLGADLTAAANLAGVFRGAGCVCGTNGGFFHPDGRPLGLVIRDGQRINRLETAKLLSGVIYSDDRGIQLVRRAQFRDHRGIRALLQSGPYLVDAGRAARGLSSDRGARRTFIATDWRGHWALGVTPGRITLSELATGLATPGAITPWPTARALNLDGGSSSAFFFARPSGGSPLLLKPWKGVRNLLCVAPR